MRGYCFSMPMLLAASACAHLINIEVSEQKGFQDSVTASCFWDGTAPFCAGACGSGYNICARDGCGDGACCFTGYKAYCCQGGCPAVLPTLEREPGSLNPTGGPHDDYCPPGKHVLCPPGASKDEDCTCLADEVIKGHKQSKPDL